MDIPQDANVSDFIGKSFYVPVRTQTQMLVVACIILNAKREYGHARFLVRTIAGDSEWWTQKLDNPYNKPPCIYCEKI
jgi:hypothetical protein